MTPRWLVLRKSGEPRLAADLAGAHPWQVSRFLAHASPPKAAGLKLATLILKWSGFRSGPLPAALPDAVKIEQIVDIGRQFLSLPAHARLDVAVYFGTPCIFQCAVFWIGQGMGQSAYGCYAKIPLAGKRAKACIMNESATLDELSRDALIADFIPKSFRSHMLNGNCPALVIEDAGGRPIAEWSPEVGRLLRCLAEIDKQETHWRISPPANAISAAIQKLEGGEWHETSEVLLRCYDRLCKEWNGTQMPMARAHGDFSLWNLRIKSSGITALDWAWSATEAFGYDFFNYFIMRHCVRPGGAELAYRWYMSSGNGLFESTYPSTGYTRPSTISLLFKTYIASALAFHSRNEAEYQQSVGRTRPVNMITELTRLCRALFC